MIDIQNVKEELVGKTVNYKGQNLTIKDVESIGADIMINCDDGKRYMLIQALKKSMVVDKDTYEYLTTLIPDLNENKLRLEEEHRLYLEEQRRLREEEAEKERIRKEEEKYNRHVQSCINSYRKSIFAKVDEDTVEWLRKHAKSIKAVIPDFLENEFIKDFPGAPYKVVDTKSKRTSGGYLYQWAAGFKLTVDKKFESEMPEELQKLAKGNVIQNNGLIRTLVVDYGFNFS